ncbi:hypothetical protein GCM10011609_17320 [Lentzea pudingi]|uniref:Uncharacterized protein n=1 Tax=Lentzea pudingi TaxID=1789439 RepID=A0ABQ2HHH7_9PSEU|nr:hypothetical protein [Lentzea pudingi]GGM81835.1 hypothetical protein GCM10011609_17320 [Lentzea pudingi]
MNRLLSAIIAITVAATSALLVTAPTTAQAATEFVTAAAHDVGARAEGGWTRYRRFDNMMLCEAAGFSGILAGRWTQWRCDDQNVLWIITSNKPLSE